MNPEPNLKLVDSHHHFPQKSDFKKLIHQSKQLGVQKIFLVSNDVDQAYKILNLSKNYNTIVPCVGIHPENSFLKKNEFEKCLELIDQLYKEKRQFCLGEIGLDDIYPYFTSQLGLFQDFLEVSEDYSLTAIVHCRGHKSFQTLIELLEGYEIRVVMHWYSGGLKYLEKFRDHNVLFGFPPMRSISQTRSNIFKKVDLKRILTETDGGYTSWKPWQVKITLDQISKIKNLSIEKVSNQIFSNAIGLLPEF